MVAALFSLTGAGMVAAPAPHRELADHLGFSVARFRGIGGLQLAGAAGVLIGLALPWLGAIASVGLGLLTVGAAIAHARVGDNALKVLAPLGCSVGAFLAAALFLQR